MAKVVGMYMNEDNEQIRCSSPRREEREWRGGTVMKGMYMIQNTLGYVGKHSKSVHFEG